MKKTGVFLTTAELAELLCLRHKAEGTPLVSCGTDWNESARRAFNARVLELANAHGVSGCIGFMPDGELLTGSGGGRLGGALYD